MQKNVLIAGDKKDFDWKHERDLWIAETIWQVTGIKKFYYAKKDLTKLKIHCIEQRAKQLERYRGFKTFNAFIRHRDNHLCYLCGKYINYGESNIDHDLAVIRGGLTIESNCHDTHRTCNLAKGTMTAHEYWKKQQKKSLLFH